MPTYTYVCPKCKEKWDKVNLIKDRKDGGKCPNCLIKGKQIHAYSTTNVNPDWKPFLHQTMPGEETIITSRKHFFEETKRRGVVTHAH